MYGTLRSLSKTKQFRSLGIHLRYLATQRHNFGLCIDIDGVLLRGKAAIPGSRDAMRRLTDSSGRFKYPVVFLTNSSLPADRKAKELSEIFNIQTNQEHFVMATSPLKLFKSYHNKKCLFLGQDDLKSMAKSLGFTNVCTIEDIARVFPLLDTISHLKRAHITSLSVQPQSEEARNWTPVEVIVLFTSPLQWETVLQLTCDLLLTQGDPRLQVEPHRPRPQLPIILCNPDMQFMHASHIPRFGHGPFVFCLEKIYKMLTGKDIVYEAILGKPSEATFQYAEYCLQNVSRDLNNQSSLSTMYMIGDNQQVDILGANLYRQYKLQSESNKLSLPTSRRLSTEALTKETISNVYSYLLCSGVYKHQENAELLPVHCQRDFEITPDLLKPDKICDSINDAIDDIFLKENIKEE